MTALASERTARRETWLRSEFTLASGHKAWKGGRAALNLSTGKVEPAASGEGPRLQIGFFTETVDATAADKTCIVEFDREIAGRWQANSGTSALAATDVGRFCYVEDDQTVAKAPTGGGSVAGRVWAVSATRGVFVELPAQPDALPALAPAPALPAFTANNINVPDNVVPGAIYDIPTTAGVSTVTLPATAQEGTITHFVADGTKNGHTVQYRDATGPTVLTTALLASKRHQVTAIFLNGKWTANAYTAP